VFDFGSWHCGRQGRKCEGKGEIEIKSWNLDQALWKARGELKSWILDRGIVEGKWEEV